MVAAEVSLPPGYRPADRLALSPDGRTVIVRATIRDTVRLVRRRVDQFEAEPIAGTDGATLAFDISPDGRWLAFATGQDLLKVAMDGSSPPVLIGKAPIWISDLTWPDNATVFINDIGGGLWSVDPTGGRFVSVTVPDSARGETRHVHPLVRADGSLLFAVETLNGDRVAVTTPDRRTWTYLPAEFSGIPMAYLPSGHLVLSAGSRMAAVK